MSKTSDSSDARIKVLSLIASILFVLAASWLYDFAIRKWYANPNRVIARIYKECTESIGKRIQTGPNATPEQKAEITSKGQQECENIKLSCIRNFDQPMCTYAQKLFQNPE
jgi:hypothetical protein